MRSLMHRLVTCVQAMPEAMTVTAGRAHEEKEEAGAGQVLCC